MKFPKLCDICIEHGYYNAGISERLAMELVPSAESARLMDNRHMIFRKKKNVFSIYGDIFNAQRDFKSEFKLSFALVVPDPYFFDASNLARPEEVDSGSTRTALREGNSKTVYYFHNRRTALIDSKAYLSNGKNVDRADLVLLYPMAFTMEGLDEISDVRLSKPDLDIVDELTNKPYDYHVSVDPKDGAKVNRIFKVELTPFGSGHYAFSYKEMSEPAVFYLNDEFYGLRPFAVIDLFFFNNIESPYKPVPEDTKPPKIFHLSLPARNCKWRYKVISKFNRYEGLKISSDPSTYTFTVTSPAEGETIFQSEHSLPLRQVLESTLELRGIHVETLGIDRGASAAGGAGSQPVEGRICGLPNPMIENLVLKKLNGQREYFCDMFVYI